MEKEEEYDNRREVKYESKADSESVQQIEGDSKAPNDIETARLQMLTCSIQYWIQVIRRESERVAYRTSYSNI